MQHLGLNRGEQVIYQDAQRLLRRFLPKPVAEAIRAVATGLLTPIHFSLRSGHFISSIARKALDRNRNPIPWYTYPAINWLQAKEFAGRKVLEFGAGQSTLWWGKRCAGLVSIESDPAWVKHLSGLVASNTDLHLMAYDLTGVEEVVGNGCFDVIVIDGLNRLRAAHVAVKHLAPDGCIVFDNSDAYRGPLGDSPIL